MTFPKPLAVRKPLRGFSMIELMVAMAIGLAFIVVVLSVYLSSKTAFRRTEELSGLQAAARNAFEYVGFDARQAGMLGCQLGGDKGITKNASPDLSNDFLVPVQGFNAAVDPVFDQTGTNDASKWTANTAPVGSPSKPVFNSSGSGLPNNISIGSDVLFLRGPSTSIPLRLTESANPAVSTTTVKVEGTTSGSCASGLCANSFAMITNCTEGAIVQVNNLSNATKITTLTLKSPGMGSLNEFKVDRSEVFPMQTVVYYVAPASNGTTQSLYRHRFDGSIATGTREELIEGVENMQITYGVDNATANADASPDYTVDVYQTANAVADWGTVLSIKIALVVRAPQPLTGGLAGPGSDTANGVTVTYADTKYDRRVFTNVIALRNRIPYAAAP
jgi:type IV pilus assembly protein PilW